MTGWKAGHQTMIYLPSSSVDMSTSIIVDTLTYSHFELHPR